MGKLLKQLVQIRGGFRTPLKRGVNEKGPLFLNLSQTGPCALAFIGQVFLVLVALLSPVLLWAAPTTAERSAYHAADEQLKMAFYPVAEELAADFCRKYTNSTLLPKAILIRAQARYEQSNYVGAAELLLSHFDPRDPSADEYLYWLGFAEGKRGQYREAAKAFSRIAKEYPASEHVLDASIQEAAVLGMIPDWDRVIELLSRSNGVFQIAAAYHTRTNSPGDQVFRGFLLLSQAQMAVSNYAGAEATLHRFDKSLLNPTNTWQRQFLLCKIQLADGRTEEALQNTTNLLTRAGDTMVPALEAESAAFRASILEKLARFDEAITNYNQNLVEGRPPSRQRQAVLKISELSSRQNKVNEGAQLLEQFVSQFPDSVSADLALLTLGELRLRQFEERAGTNDPAAVATNFLAQTNLSQALNSFQTLAKKFPRSSYFAKGQLGYGWCLWFANRMPEAQQALQTATSALPVSTEQAVAYFKLADAQFRQGNFGGAIDSYEALIAKFSVLSNANVTVSNLFEPALYQEVRAGLAWGKLDKATDALTRIRNWYPNGFHTERAVLLTGQADTEAGNPRRARALFTGFINVVSNASLVPEIQLAIARTYERENDWTNAIQQYDHWLNTYTNHSARPQAEYYRAWAISQTGDRTNAFICFTNFTARFPTNDLAALARWWVADFQFGIGAFTSADKEFQTIAHDWPGTELAFQAQMMAGRSAYSRYSWNDAEGDFTGLWINTNCTLDLRFQALFALGDTVAMKTNGNYAEAMKVLEGIPRQYATNKLAALALGQRACYALQWAQSTTAGDKYDVVSNAFTEVIKSPQANVTATNIATIGLGVVLEKLALQRPDEGRKYRELALEQYVNVFLNDQEPEMFWIKFAGMEAGRLAYDMREWEKASKIYQRLQKMLPASLPSIDNRIRDCERNRTRLSKSE